MRRRERREFERRAAGRTAISTASVDDLTKRQLLGIAAYERGDFDASISAFSEAADKYPKSADAFNNLGNVLVHVGRYDEAVDVLFRAAELNPNLADAHSNLSRALGAVGRMSEAEAVSRRALALNPTLAEAYINAGSLALECGRLDGALEAFRRALEINHEHQGAWNDLLMALQYSPDFTSEALHRAAKAWGRTQLRPALSVAQRATAPKSDRLRVGYVSGDFRAHPVGYVIESIIEAHDSGRVEVCCYSTVATMDPTTERIKASSDIWRDLTKFDDKSAAELIHRDRIDVLIDLAGHSAHNRLGVFSYKPAPVQATWMGYFATTGLAQMDYILRDAIQIPAEEQQFYTESVFTLRGDSFAFTPRPDCPDVSALPASRDGFVTFGCFNNLVKINEHTIRAWCRIMHAVPGSKMVLCRKALNDPLVQAYFVELFGRHGVGPERLSLFATHGHMEYLKLYHGVDLILDTFPFNGGTTTFEALWMGVPVVSRSWDRMVGHFAESILSRCGHPNWVAKTEDEYVSIATDLVSDPARLAGIRENLRQELATSPLCQPDSCAPALEDAYWAMWEEKASSCTSAA